MQAWVDQAKPGPLSRWLGQELDPEGVPKRLAVPDWVKALELLAQAVQKRPAGWPEHFDAVAETWFRTVLRFARPDGSMAFGPSGSPDGRAELFRTWARRGSDPGLATVVQWWFPSRRPPPHSAPPLPADSRPDRPLAVLRASWSREGEFLAVDHREPGPGSRVELVAAGTSWLGPLWSPAFPTEIATPAATRARPTLWLSTHMADAFEWRFRVGRAVVFRTAILLRGRSIALLGEQWDGPGDPGGTSWELPFGVGGSPMRESRGLSLSRSGTRLSPKALPIGLPRLPYESERGSLDVSEHRLILRQASEGRRVWRPLLLTWLPERDRRWLHWRTLTVSENGTRCGPDRAFAARVSWGRDETLLIYRSLTPPVTRSFLGHQTRARLLVGLFSSEGEVEPLLKVE